MLIRPGAENWLRVITVSFTDIILFQVGSGYPPFSGLWLPYGIIYCDNRTYVYLRRSHQHGSELLSSIRLYSRFVGNAIATVFHIHHPELKQRMSPKIDSFIPSLPPWFDCLTSIPFHRLFRIATTAVRRLQSNTHTIRKALGTNIIHS